MDKDILTCDTYNHACLSPPSIPQWTSFCLRMHQGQHPEKLVFLSLVSLVRSHIWAKNANSEQSWTLQSWRNLVSGSVLCSRSLMGCWTCCKWGDVKNTRSPPLASCFAMRVTEDKCERGGGPARNRGRGGRREVLFKISCSPPAPTVCR